MIRRKRVRSKRARSTVLIGVAPQGLTSVGRCSPVAAQASRMPKYKSGRGEFVFGAAWMIG